MWLYVESLGRIRRVNEPDVRGFGGGLDRRPRVRTMAIDAMTRMVPKGDWTTCKAVNVSECLPLLTREPTRIKLGSPHDLCGAYIVQERLPLPWAWRKSHSRIERTARLARVDVECE